ncbi:hypothetical protein [Alcaligenes sp. Marseille-Q7550]
MDVVDLRADGEPADETDYATCQICGNEKIRYVHIMEHPDLDENFEVGCVCAEKMSGDYEGPKRREAKLRNRAVRRTRWLQRKWRVFAKGNSFLNVDGHNLGVQPTKTKRWGDQIDSRFSAKTYASKDEAKLALFDDFRAATRDDERLWASDRARK